VAQLSIVWQRWPMMTLSKHPSIVGILYNRMFISPSIAGYVAFGLTFIMGGLLYLELG
jgi:hypothetical protein|tara:strand:- start:743 stop:916 length:174 start_codon:yes stop_codon:yes gene_type:complete